MMPQRPLHHAALLVLALGTAATWSASAKASDQPTAGVPGAQAASFYQQGNVEFEKKNWPAAESAYLKAWAITRTFDVAANLGEVEFHLGKMRETAEYLSYSLRTAPPSSKPAQRERTTHFLEQVKEKLGILRLRVNVEGASVSINGSPIAAEEVAHEIFVDPGTCTVVATRDGYIEARATIEAKAGSSSDVALSLDVKKSSAVVSDASVSGGASTPVLVTGGVVSGLAVVAGVVFTVIANGKASDADQQRKELMQAYGAPGCTGATVPPECDTLSNSTDARATMSNLAVWSFLGAGAVGAATVIYGLAAPKHGPRQDVRVVPVVTGKSAGITIGGVW